MIEFVGFNHFSINYSTRLRNAGYRMHHIPALSKNNSCYKLRNFNKSENLSMITLCLILLIVSYSNETFSSDTGVVPGRDLAGVKVKIEVLQE